jgi:hypothetical protein
MSPDPHDDETPRNRAGRALPEDDETNADPDSEPRTVNDDPTVAGSPAARESDSGPESAEAGLEASGDSDRDAESTAEYGPVEGAGPRDVVVPTRVFKLVTVVTTLLAVPAVVLGFMFLDAATLQTTVARATVLLVVSWLGVPVDESVLSVVFGLVGIALIVAGAGIYVVGSRFRAAGMGNAEEDTDEHSDNG